MGRAWLRYWFAPAPPERLAICRVLFFGGMFLYNLPVDFSAWATVAPVYWRPTGLFRALALPVLPGAVLGAAAVVWKAALLAAALGLRTRVATAVALVLGAYLLGLPHNFAKVRHADAILVFVLAIMAVARPGDALSLDRRRAGAAPPAASGEYTWPVRAVWLTMSIAFFAAGVAKLRFSGLAWVGSDTLRNLLIDAQYGLGRFDVSDLGLAVAGLPWLCHALAALTLAIELLFPLAMVSRRARLVIVPAALLMQVAIRVLMGPSFAPYLLVYLFWVPWAARSRGARGAP